MTVLILQAHSSGKPIAQVCDYILGLSKSRLHVVRGNNDKVLHGRGRIFHVDQLVSPPLCFVAVLCAHASKS